MVIPYLKEKDFLIQTINEAIQIYINDDYIDVQHKGTFDLVTNVDLNIETFIRTKIKENFPNDCIVGEEFSPSLDENNKGRWWTIDPIDGTVNFAHRFPIFGIQAALVDQNKPVLSVIILPKLNETFWAIKNHGAYWNDKKITTKDKNIDIHDAIVFCGDFSHKNECSRLLQLKAIQQLSKTVAKIKMVGAACCDYTSIACGRGDGLISITKNVWDILPGILICRESGVLVKNLNGDEHQLGDDGVIVANNEPLLKELLCSLK